MNDSIASGRTAGIILIGTHSWSNSAFDAMMPRVMLPVAHRPLISYALSWLEDAGITSASVCGNRQTGTLRHLLSRHVPRALAVSYHEDPMPRGAAGCIRDAAAASDADTFVVVDGSTIPNVHLTDLLARHRASSAIATVVVNCEPRRHGNPGLQVPTGIYIFDRRAIDLIPERGFCDIKEKLIPQLYRTGQRVLAYPTPGAIPRVMDVGTYLAVNEWVVEHLLAGEYDLDGYVRNRSVLAHRDAYVSPNAVFVGPVVVGAGARIESGAVIVGPTSIGQDVIIARDGLISRSAVWRRSSVGAQAQVDRSILTDDTVVGVSEHAFRALKIGAEQRQPEPVRTAKVHGDAHGVPALELRRGWSRVFPSVSWSRSPAAQ